MIEETNVRSDEEQTIKFELQRPRHRDEDG